MNPSKKIDTKESNSTFLIYTRNISILQCNKEFSISLSRLFKNCFYKYWITQKII